MMDEIIFTPCHCAALRKAARRVSALYDEALHETGLKTTQFTLLSTVDRQPEPPSLRELAAMLVMDRSTLGHNLRPLQRSGYLQLVPHASDRRSSQVRLTPVGRRKLGQARRLWREVQVRLGPAFQARPSGSLHDTLLAIASLR